MINFTEGRCCRSRWRKRASCAGRRKGTSCPFGMGLRPTLPPPGGSWPGLVVGERSVAEVVWAVEHAPPRSERSVIKSNDYMVDSPGGAERAQTDTSRNACHGCPRHHWEYTRLEAR